MKKRKARKVSPPKRKKASPSKRSGAYPRDAAGRPVLGGCLNPRNRRKPDSRESW